MTNGKPVTDSGEIGRRKEEKKSNLFWPVGIALALALVFAFAGIFLPNLQQPASTSNGVSDAGASAGNQPQQPVVTAVTPVGTGTPTQTAKIGEIPINLPMTVSPDINQADLKLNLFYTGDNPLIKGYIEYPYLKEGMTLGVVLLKDGKPVEGYALPQKNFSFGFLRGSQADVAEIKSRYTIWVRVR